MLTNLSLEAGPAYANTLTLCRQPLRRRLMGADLRGTLNGHDPGSLLRESYATAPQSDVLGGMIAADVAVILPDDFLVKVDRASMAHGLEVRPPLVDHELMELAARIPSRWKVHDGQTKWIFKQRLSRRSLPESILRRTKQGFEIPIDDWLRGPLRPMFESAVLDRSARVADLIDQNVARRIYRSHLRNGGRGTEPRPGLGKRYLSGKALLAPGSGLGHASDSSLQEMRTLLPDWYERIVRWTLDEED